jgi:hypothetical protein
LPVFAGIDKAGIETYKMGTFHQNYFLLKKIIGQYSPNLLCFFLANWTFGLKSPFA